MEKEKHPKPKETDSPKMPEISEDKIKEMKEKFQELKNTLDKFKKKVLDKFNEYIVGISLLPPEKQPQDLPPELAKTMEKPNPNDMNVLLLVDDSDVKKMTRWELRDKIVKIIDKMAEEVNKNIKPE